MVTIASVPLSIPSYHPSITTTTTRTHPLHSASPLPSTSKSESWMWHGGGWRDRHLWPSPALSGLCCHSLIVLRDVDNHNRRRAGESQSSKERGKGEDHWGAAFVWKKCQACSVCVLSSVAGGMGYRNLWSEKHFKHFLTALHWQTRTLSILSPTTLKEKMLAK